MDRLLTVKPNVDDVVRQAVSAHVRYGRLSTGLYRRGTYTMTFSARAARGRVYVAPTRRTVGSFDDLRDEAESLAAAEGLGNASSWASFGVVGALFRQPDPTCVAGLRAQWSAYFANRQACDLKRTFACLRETPPVDDAGVLQMPWPDALESGPLSSIDILLATVNEPTPDGGHYANADRIARSLSASPFKAEYLRKNVQFGIRTPYDCEIWRSIENLRPAPLWVAEPEYRELATTVCEPSLLP